MGGGHAWKLGAGEVVGLQEDEDGADEEDVDGDLAEGVSGAYGGGGRPQTALDGAGDADGDGGDEDEAEEKAETEKAGDGAMGRVFCEGDAGGE